MRKQKETYLIFYTLMCKSLPSDKGQSRINTFIIFYPKRKETDRTTSDKCNKAVERSSSDHYYNHHNT